MSRPGLIVVDAAHWLDDGDLPVDAPNELFRNAFRVAQCIEYGGPIPPKHLVKTMIDCRRRPGGRGCRGTMVVCKTGRDELYVLCSVCQSEEFLISNWQSTHFALGVPDPLPLSSDPFAPFDDEADDETEETPASGLILADGSLDFDAVRALVATAENPQAVIQEVFAAKPPRSESAANALASTVFTLWNATPRPELGGKSPEEVYSGRKREPAASSKIGRNQPCPCGSGLKHKRCCAH